jgi:hypothetical protein
VSLTLLQSSILWEGATDDSDRCRYGLEDNDEDDSDEVAGGHESNGREAEMGSLRAQMLRLGLDKNEEAVSSFVIFR